MCTICYTEFVLTIGKRGIHMGLFDKLLKKGLQAVTEAVSDAVTDTIKENFGQSETQVYTQSETAAPAGNRPVVSESTVSAYDDNRSFDMKFLQIMQSIEGYEVIRNYSPEAFEAEVGIPLYPKNGCYAEPDNFTYVLLKNGERKGMVNLWYSYEDYKHKANRMLKEYCVSNGLKVVDFFDYMPNEYEYMKERIYKEFA